MKTMLIILSVILGMPAGALAGGAETSTVHVYRATDEGAARRISFHLLNGKDVVGELSSGDVATVELAPGTYTLRSNLDRSRAFTVEVTGNGEPLYVEATFVRAKGRYTTDFRQVAPSVASASSPRLAQMEDIGAE